MSPGRPNRRAMYLKCKMNYLCLLFNEHFVLKIIPANSETRMLLAYRIGMCTAYIYIATEWQGTSETMNKAEP